MRCLQICFSSPWEKNRKRRRVTDDVSPKSKSKRRMELRDGMEEKLTGELIPLAVASRDEKCEVEKCLEKNEAEIDSSSSSDLPSNELSDSTKNAEQADEKSNGKESVKRADWSLGNQTSTIVEESSESLFSISIGSGDRHNGTDLGDEKEVSSSSRRKPQAAVSGKNDGCVLAQVTNMVVDTIGSVRGSRAGPEARPVN